MVEALGTIFTAIVALFLGLRGDIRRYFDRPMIHVDFDEEELKMIVKDSCNFVLRVTNTGKTTALNVKIRIIKIVQDGINLLKPSEETKFVLDAENIQNNEIRQITFLMFSRIEGKEMRVYTYSRTGDSKGYTGGYIEKKTTSFHLLITGDNFTSKQITLQYLDAEEYEKMTLKKL